VLWKPPYPNRSNRLINPEPDFISRDTGIKLEELPAAKANRLVWKSLVHSIPVEAAG